MNDLSREYAKAIFEIATEEGKSKEYRESFSLIRDVILDNPQYIALLSSPAIEMSERKEAINKAFGKAVPENILSYIKLLCEKGHLKFLLDSIDEFNDMYEKINKITTARVKSATELLKGQKAALLEKLEKITGGRVVIDYEIDESIIGGLIIEMDGKIIDGSLKGQLQSVKEVIKK